MHHSRLKNQGKVIKSTRNHYLVRFGDKTLKCVVRGKLVGKSHEDLSTVKVGDNVRGT